MRKVHELRERGITIVFVSHAMGDVKAIGDRAMWLDGGHLREIGETDKVVARYMAAMVEKDSNYLTQRHAPQGTSITAGRITAPEVIEHIPHMDHRHGDGRAEVIGIAVLDEQGDSLPVLQPSSTIVVRISVRANDDLTMPNVGFMLRNHMGLDFAGTNTMREDFELPPMHAGDIFTVDFHVQLPELYASSYSFSPAIADGTLHSYVMCDWIDNAITLQMITGDGADLRLYTSSLPRRVEQTARPRHRHATAAVARGVTRWLNSRASALYPTRLVPTCGANISPAMPSRNAMPWANAYSIAAAAPAMDRPSWRKRPRK